MKSAEEQQAQEEMSLGASAQSAQLATASPQPLNVAHVLEAAVRGGVTAENVSVVKELVALQERMQAKEAEKAFARAFNALQSELPPIHAVKPVPDRDGNIKYHFAPYESIMEQARPFLLKHGFAVSFSMTADEGRITQTCTLRHVEGHSQSNSSSVRIGKGPPGATETQADGAASTYAKRFAFCDALNIVIERDGDGAPTDAKVIGAPIDRDKVQYLREQCRELGGSAEAQLLKLAGVEKFEEVGDAIYPVLVRMIEGRKAAARKAQ